MKLLQQVSSGFDFIVSDAIRCCPAPHSFNVAFICSLGMQADPEFNFSPWHTAVKLRCSNCFTRWVMILSRISMGESIGQMSRCSGRMMTFREAFSQPDFAQWNQGTKGKSHASLSLFAMLPARFSAHTQCWQSVRRPSTTIGMFSLSCLQTKPHKNMFHFQGRFP